MRKIYDSQRGASMVEYALVAAFLAIASAAAAGTVGQGVSNQLCQVEEGFYPAGASVGSGSVSCTTRLVTVNANQE